MEEYSAICDKMIEAYGCIIENMGWLWRQGIITREEFTAAYRIISEPRYRWIEENYPREDGA